MSLKFFKRIFALFPHVAKESLYWMKRDILYSSSTLVDDEKSMLSWLMIKTHIIEKGLTMPDRRLGFGYDRVRGLLSKTQKTIERFSHESVEVQTVINDLEQYLLLHEEGHFDLPDDISMGIRNLLNYKIIETEKCYQENRERYFAKTSDFAMFSKQRRSVRWYSDERIDDSIIKDCISLAQNAPSACNRQSIKVYVVSTQSKKDAIFELQTGNRGFGHMADKIVLITSDQRCWNWRERSLAYIDAGIFAMNMLYAFHYNEINACPLNALMSIKNEKKLRKIINYSKTEIPMLFISIGRAPEKFLIPGSQRLKTETICQFV